MRTFNNFRSLIAGTQVLVAFSLGLSVLPAQSDPKPQVRSSLVSYMGAARISPPHAGVKLLEDIMARMRSIPQIAMNKKTQTVNYQQQAQGPLSQPGATDPLLAIKPPQQKLDKAKAQTLAMAPPSYYEPLPKAKEREADYDRAEMKQNLDNWSSARKKVGSFKGGKDITVADARIPPPAPAAPAAKPALAGAGGSAGYYRTSNNYYNSPQQQQFNQTNIAGTLRDAENRLSPESRRRLSASTSKLLDVARKMEEAQNMANSQQIATVPPGAAQGSLGRQSAPSLPRANFGKHQGYRGDNMYSGGAADQIAPAKDGKARVISHAPQITEYNERQQQIASAPRQSQIYGDEGAFSSAQGASSMQSADDQPAAEKPSIAPGFLKHVREFLGGNQEESKARIHATQTEAEGGDKQTPMEIALLPPSVVTGIPLVRLGTAEPEVNRALGSMGSFNRVKINQWSVWSLRKPGAREDSLQIYLRNGTVEAIRIFDSSLIAPDFGLKLGDDLPTVKQKFGEPAFILSEPVNSRGQNFVYPLSQVSFQLARQSSKAKPQVVSLLIFNAR